MKTFADYTIYCTNEQVQRLKKLNAPLEEVEENTGIFLSDSGEWETIYQETPVMRIEDKYYYLPTAEQVIGWLREKNIFIDIFYDKGEIWFDVGRISDLQYFKGYSNKTYSTAILEAINSALDYLEKQNK